MRKFRNMGLMMMALWLTACAGTDLNKIIQGAGASLPLTEQEVASGLREALIQGISKGADNAAQVDGYFRNELIRILLPEDARRVENTLRQIGLGAEVDRALLSINRGAERAALQAKPIFIAAIRQLTIQDAFNILRGEENAATNFLRRTTEAQLVAAFQPEIQKALQEVGATRHYSDLANAYNAIPLTNRKIDPDLDAYVTARAIDGLFVLVAQEEKNIRENPGARTTALLRRVFGSQN